MSESPRSRPPAAPTVQVDNDRVIVTEWRFPPGGETGWHRHEYDYVVVPQSSGTLTIESTDGITESPLVTGQAYARQAGVEHNVINDSDDEFVFVEIEIR